MIDKTVEYYNENAQSFFETTVNVDMSLQLEDFIKLLPADGYVLDAGCGSGRDNLVLKRSHRCFRRDVQARIGSSRPTGDIMPI